MELYIITAVSPTGKEMTLAVFAADEAAARAGLERRFTGWSVTSLTHKTETCSIVMNHRGSASKNFKPVHNKEITPW